MAGTGWQGFVIVSLACLLAVVMVQTATWAAAQRLGRYNVVDVTWGPGFVAIAAVAAVVGGGDPLRRVLLLILTAAWGLRLGRHMYVRTKGKGEDPRYQAMLDGVSPAAAVRKVFVTQGVAQWFVSLPLQVSAVVGATRGVWLVVLIASVVTWSVGIVFEAIGDRQLARFKADPANKGAIMDRGLWAWTRHPNYFGDACVWWGLWAIAASAWPGVLTVASPVVMTYFLVFATGARLLEKAMSKRPGYPEYQARTSYFLPRPPKRARAAT